MSAASIPEYIVSRVFDVVGVGGHTNNAKGAGKYQIQEVIGVAGEWCYTPYCRGSNNGVRALAVDNKRRGSAVEITTAFELWSVSLVPQSRSFLTHLLLKQALC